MSKDTIYRADAIEAIKSNVVAITPTQIDAVADCIKCVESIPSAQPKIVRCKDCKYNSICNHSVQHTTRDALTVTIGYNSVDFCSYGERMEVEHEDD